jgi:hypothetical protein
MIRLRRTRRGVTLVEMLVAAAMCIMGMWLLTWLYQQGLESFRLSRAQADLTAQQRMVTQIMTRDLTAAHFDKEATKPNQGTKLSDQRLDQIKFIPDPTDTTGKRYVVDGYTPPKFGYFRAGSFPDSRTDPTSPNIYEGYDGVADSSRSTNHFLQFTAILPGGPSFQLFSAQVPAVTGTQYYGTAAEITYFLSPSGLTTPNGYPLYDLYRRQRLAARTSDDASAYNSDPNKPTNQLDAKEVMALKPNPNTNPDPVNLIATLSDLTIPGTSGYRLPTPFTPLGSGGTPSPRYGEDKLMSNVLSFEVKFTGTADAALGVIWPRPFGPQNTDAPYDTLPNDGIFDTFSQNVTNWNWMTNVAGPTASGLGGDTAPMKPIRITGVQIRLRTYEPKTRSTRQTTLVLDL